MTLKQIYSFFRRESVRIILYVCLFVAVSLILIQVLTYFDLTIDDIQEFARRFGWFGPVILTLFTTVSLVFSPLSSSSIVIGSVVLYGPSIAFGIGLVSGIVGGSINYTLAYLYGQAFIKKFIGPKTLAIVQDKAIWIKSRGFWALILIFPFSLDIVSYGAGLVKIPRLHFFVSLFFAALFNSLFVVALASGALRIL